MNCLQRAAGTLAILLVACPASAPAMDVGINFHHAGALNAQVAQLMQHRNFRSARMDFFWDRDPAPLRDMAARVRANGGTVQVSLQVAYQWDASCRRDLAALEQQAHDQAVAAIDKVKDVVRDFELLNETQLRPEIKREVPWNSARLSTAPYEGKPCVASLAAALRGMSRAVADVRAASGLPLRSILGVVGRDFGFLTYMRAQGVQWDVTGFHIYPRSGQRNLLDDWWYGTGGPFAQLARFGKPVHVNEINCGETYDDGYGWASSVETCLRGLAGHLKSIVRQQAARIESVHFYELLDEPEKAPPENRFGLMQDIGRPKVQLFLATAFAGGTLSPAERLELTRRGLLADAEIDALQAARAGPAAARAPQAAPN